MSVWSALLLFIGFMIWGWDKSCREMEAGRHRRP